MDSQQPTTPGCEDRDSTRVAHPRRALNMKTSVNVLALPQEIISHICSHLWVQCDYYFERAEQDSRTLAALARTCAQFYAPAVSVLWHTLCNLSPLIYTLPSDLCVDSYDLDQDGKDVLTARWKRKTLVRAPTPGDFHRWHKYAALIRAVNLQHPVISPYNMVLHPEAWKILKQYGLTTVLPRVQLLDISDIILKTSSLDYTHFFNSSLTTARLYFRDPDHDLLGNIEALAASCPRVEEIRLWPDPFPPLLGRRIIGDYPRMSSMPPGPAFTHLRELRIEWIYVQSPALNVISALPSLLILYMTLLAADYSGANSMDAVNCKNHGAAFARLQELEVLVNDLSLATSFIAVVSSQRLQKLSVAQINAPQVIASSALGTLFSTVASHPSRDSIRSFRVRVHLYQPPHNFWETFTPLLELSALSELELRGWSSICVGPDTLDAMSRAWPMLQHLTLHHPASLAAVDADSSHLLHWGRVFVIAPAQRSRITLVDLLPLARRCPRLESVALALDPWPIPGIHTIHDQLVLPSGTDLYGNRVHNVRPETESLLTSLYVGYCGVWSASAADVAPFLSSVFPRLTRVAHEDDYPGGRDAEGWREVNRFLRVVHRMREDERRWAVQDGRIGNDPAAAVREEFARRALPPGMARMIKERLSLPWSPSGFDL